MHREEYSSDVHLLMGRKFKWRNIPINSFGKKEPDKHSTNEYSCPGAWCSYPGIACLICSSMKPLLFVGRGRDDAGSTACPREVGQLQHKCASHSMILRCPFQARCPAWHAPVMFYRHPGCPPSICYGRKTVRFSVQILPKI